MKKGSFIAYWANLAGLIAASVVIYYVTPYIAKITNASVQFYYLFLYVGLAMYGIRTAKQIECGEHPAAKMLNKIYDEEGGKV
ncbi:hypothetical protein ACM7NO_26425 [Pseudomonas aeruginosa]